MVLVCLYQGDIYVEREGGREGGRDGGRELGFWMECVRVVTLGAHAQRGYGSWVCVSVCVCVCYLTSHFSNVRLSHKRYDLPNGQ